MLYTTPLPRPIRPKTPFNTYFYVTFAIINKSPVKSIIIPNYMTICKASNIMAFFKCCIMLTTMAGTKMLGINSEIIREGYISSMIRGNETKP